jgi:hypothetical protein
MKVLTLTFPHPLLDREGIEHYKVVQVEQDVSIDVGSYLTKAYVRDLCEMTGTWKVVIKAVPK